MVIQRIMVSAEFLYDVMFVMSFLWHSNSYIIIMILHDLHKIKKSVTKFCIHIKRTDRSHRHIDVLQTPLNVSIQYTYCEV